jgi:hypothetical protein
MNENKRGKNNEPKVAEEGDRGVKEGMNENKRGKNYEWEVAEEGDRRVEE